VESTLLALGYSVKRLGCDLNLEAHRQALTELKPSLVFNLVEALGGSDRMIAVAPLLYEAMGLPYTGSPAVALVITSDKVDTKRLLQEAGLPTPGWLAQGCQARLSFPGRYILKCTAEHASFALHDDAVVQARDGDELALALSRQQERVGRPCFAEGYVDGREFNISLLSSAEGPVVLPPAEIDFSTFPHGKPRIVGYEAKWDESSFEYVHTPRVFDFPAADRKLLSQLSSLALRAYKLLGLRGYGRIDFRVNAQGQPWILEANCNPCLSPDAGFQAALARAGIGFDEAVRRIIADSNLTPVTAESLQSQT
jgi:D-alanine-D-alanine ligase